MYQHQYRNEAALVRAAALAIKREHPTAFVTKIHGGGYQEVGLPDLLAIDYGIAVWLEFKHRKPGESEEHARERTTFVQHAVMARLRLAGVESLTVLSVDEALDACARAWKRPTLRNSPSVLT